MGQDEHDIPIEPDEKPKTCGDLLCDVSIEPPRKLKRVRTERSHVIGGTSSGSGWSRTGRPCERRC